MCASHKGHGCLSPTADQVQSLSPKKLEVEVEVEVGAGWELGAGALGGVALPPFSSAPCYVMPEKVIKSFSQQRLRLAAPQGLAWKEGR